MAMRSGLFNSEKIVETVDGFPRGDRAELADFFAKYFSAFIGNGVFPNPSTNFQVLAYDQMTVRVAPGLCWINGYFGWDVEDTTLVFPSDTAAHTYRIVLRLSLTSRDITLAYLGDDTDLTRTETVWELALADIRVRANQITIAQSDITDLRLNGNLCGIVHGVVDQIDTTTLGNQLNSFIDNYLALTESTYNQYRASLQGMESDAEQKHAEFLAWVITYKQDAQAQVQGIINSIQGILGEDTAGHLLNLIGALRTEADSHEERITALENVKAVGLTVFDISLPASSWLPLETPGRYRYYADYAHEAISLAHIPDLTLDASGEDIAYYCGLSPRIETPEEGKLRLFAVQIPAGPITGTCRLWTMGGTGGSSEVASDEEVSAAIDSVFQGGNSAVASDADASTMLNDVFGGK